MSSKIVWGKMSVNGVKIETPYRNSLISSIANMSDIAYALGAGSRIPRNVLSRMPTDRLEGMRDMLSTYLEGVRDKSDAHADIVTMEAYARSFPREVIRRNNAGLFYPLKISKEPEIEEVRNAEDHAEGLRKILSLVSDKLIQAEIDPIGFSIMTMHENAGIYGESGTQNGSNGNKIGKFFSRLAQVL